MTTIEVLVIVIAAFYSVVGGAFLNAAITNPKNCKRALIYIARSKFFAVAEFAWLAVIAFAAFHFISLRGTPEYPGRLAIAGFLFSHLGIQPALLLIYFLADELAE